MRTKLDRSLSVLALCALFVSQIAAAENTWLSLGNSQGDEGGMYIRDAQDTAGQQARVTWDYGRLTMRFGNMKGDVWFFATGATRYAFTNSAPYAYKAGGGQWSAWSDRRLKTDIRDFKIGLNAVLRLKPRSFQYNGRTDVTPDDGKIYSGFVAQELREVLPFAVNATGELLDGEPLLSVDSSAVTYVLVNAVQEQAKALRELQSRANQLTKAVCVEYRQLGQCK